MKEYAEMKIATESLGFKKAIALRDRMRELKKKFGV